MTDKLTLREKVLLELDLARNAYDEDEKEYRHELTVDAIATILEDTGSPAHMRVAAELRGGVMDLSSIKNIYARRVSLVVFFAISVPIIVVLFVVGFMIAAIAEAAHGVGVAFLMIRRHAIDYYHVLRGAASLWSA